jgi:hypothetical protein
MGPFYLSRLLVCFTRQVQRKGFCDIFPGKNIIFPLSCAASFLDFDSVMTPEELFTVALDLGDQWHVSRCVFEGEPKRLELELKHVSGKQFECLQCGSLCAVHDTVERRWRHMNFFPPRRMRLGGQGASHLVSHRWGPSDQGPMGQGRKRVYPLDGRAHIAPKRSDARRCHGRFARRTRYPVPASATNKDPAQYLPTSCTGRTYIKS